MEILSLPLDLAKKIRAVFQVLQPVGQEGLFSLQT